MSFDRFKFCNLNQSKLNTLFEQLKQHSPSADITHKKALNQLAKTQQSGFGGIVSFEVKGGKAAAFKLINAVEIFSYQVRTIHRYRT
jgi:cystathionine beta-lyase/cystathionine gamma-synthase